MRSEEDLAGIWRELVDESGGDLRAAMRELRKITDPMADMRVRDLPERPDGRASVPVTL